jgi:hypothetical protein
MAYKLQTEMMKLFILASTLGQLAKSGVFDMALVTKRGKTIPTMGSMVLKMEELEEYTFKCDKVVAHNDGSFTGLYGGVYVRFLPFNYLTDKMYYGELK